MTLLAADSSSIAPYQKGIPDAGTHTDARDPSSSGNLSNWIVADADIQLQPTSCLDVYQNLILRNLPLELLAEQSTTGSQSSALVTRHQAAELALRCRKVLAATEEVATDSSVKSKCYIAAGFITYNSRGDTHRIPVLLIPVTIDRLRGRGSSYTLQYQAGTRLHVNPKVRELCESHVDELIKPFESVRDFRDYLRGLKSQIHSSLQCDVTANTGIVSLRSGELAELSNKELVDLELERTKPGIDFKALPATPANFDPQLAIRILRFVPQDEVPTTLANFVNPQNAIDNQARKQTASVAYDDLQPELDEATLEKYYNCASWLTDVGLGSWKLRNIAALGGRIDRMISNINALINSDLYQKNIRPEFRTINTLYKTNVCRDKILNSPSEMHYHATTLHTDPQTQILLQQAKIQASSIEHELSGIAETYHMSALPRSETLQKLIETIALRDTESQLTNPHYFTARSRLSEILKTHNGMITDNDLARLEKVAKTLKFSECFNEDPYYKRYFGSLFNGTDTNWQRLDSVVNYTAALAKELDTPLLMAQWVDRWDSFVRDYSQIASQLDAAVGSASKLCQLIPMFIDQNTRLEHAVRSAEKLRDRVNQWHAFLQKHNADNELTPLQLLSGFDLDSHSAPNVTLPQQELDQRIHHHIIGNGLPASTVSATSSWLLNVIERLQTDVATVRRFLDREAELATKLQPA